jgi:hypothetical protein
LGPFERANLKITLPNTVGVSLPSPKWRRKQIQFPKRCVF